MKKLFEARLGYIVVLAVMVGGVAVAAMIYGYSIQFKLPLPHIELSVAPNK